MITLLLIAHILGFFSSFHALMSTRTAQGTIAWIVSLNTFPLLTVPAYWVLGRNKFKGYVTLRRQVESKSSDKVETVGWEGITWGMSISAMTKSFPTGVIPT